MNFRLDRTCDQLANVLTRNAARGPTVLWALLRAWLLAPSLALFTTRSKTRVAPAHWPLEARVSILLNSSGTSWPSGGRPAAEGECGGISRPPAYPKSRGCSTVLSTATGGRWLPRGPRPAGRRATLVADMALHQRENELRELNSGKTNLGKDGNRDFAQPPQGTEQLI